MRPDYRIIACISTICACVVSVTEQAIPFEFGKFRAHLNGSEFAGSFSSDSVIAIYSSNSGQMQIEGNRRRPGNPRIVRVFLRCTGFPKAGTYAIKSSLSPVSAEAFLGPSAWDRAWPIRGREIRGFISDSMPPGNLILETSDSLNGVVRGRLAVSLRSYNRVPAETLHVKAAFFGRVSMPEFPWRDLRWSPMFDRDCERIRNAVSM